MKRLIYNELLNWKNSKNRKPLMIYGARQVGKSYIIEEFCQNEYNKYIKIDFKKEASFQNLFSEKKDFEEIYEELKIRLIDKIDIEDSNNILFFDEIQVCKQFIAYLKYFCEDHNNVNIVCAGSLLGTMLNREEVFVPTGKTWDIQMFPMNFEEFLIALNKEAYVDKIKDCYNKNKKIGDFLHNELMKLYRIYSYIGGMPESIKNFIENDCKLSAYNDNIIDGIIKKYMEDMNQYVKNNTETLRINEIYTNIGSQLGNISNKFQPAKIDKNKRLEDYKSAINWLYTSNLVLRCFCISLPEPPLKAYINEDVFKLYLSDCGILSHLVELKKKNIIENTSMIFNGIIAENYVAKELTFNNVSLYYWISNNTAEVDFVVDINDGIIPIEVKSGGNTKAKSLKLYIDKYKPTYGIRVSSGDFSYNDTTKIKDIPLYAIFCIK